ncbi:unnamed protein product [Alopecurus aequalis]
MVAAESPPLPAPPPHAAPDRAHPTYTKMITHALTGLGGRSERSGIAGYIHGSFSGFPPCHDALLSAHLRRLVAEGVLRTDGADSPSYTFTPPPAAGEKRGPGRPRKDGGASTPVATPLGEKRGPGRPRKDGGAPTPVATPLGEKRGPGRPRKDGGAPTPVATLLGEKRGRGRPRKSPAAAAMSPEPGMPPSYTAGSKRRPGRPRKEKPSGAASSPTAGAAASRGFKRGCGRPTMDRALAAESVSAESRMEKLAAAAAAMYAETGDAASTGGGQSRMEKLAAAVAAMSAEGTKRGRGRPRKLKPPSMSAAYEAFFKHTTKVKPPSVSAEGTKRGRGRPRKVKPPSVSAYEAFFRDMMTEANNRRRRREEDEDSVSGEKTQTEEGVAPGERKETRAADAGRVPVSGENAASAPAGAIGPDLGPGNLADAAASTGIKRPRGRPRKYPAAAADDSMSTGAKRRRVRPRNENPGPAATSSPETGDAASTGVKRGPGRPRKKPSAATGVKRSRGRPRKDQSIGTGFVEAASKVLFRDPGDLISEEKTQTEGVTPGDMKETRVAGAGHVPVSGENAASAHVGALCSDSNGPANL